MIHWFFIALIPPLLWGLVNHLDKFMLSKYIKDKGVGSLLIISCLAPVLFLPFIIFFYGNNLFNILFSDILLLFFIGLTSALAFYFYLLSMEEEEASIVIPLFQLVPVFGYFLGFIVLGENLTLQQIFASLLILFGMTILALEVDEDYHFKFKFRVFGLVALSSFLFALHDILFKKVALVENFWVSVFWQYLALFFVGILIFIFIKSFRKNFISVFKNAGGKIVTLNIFGEILYLIGNVSNSFATLLAPVVLVLVVSSYQPLFVFLIAIFLTVFFPKITTENISRKHIIHKLISILIIIIGSYFLYVSSPY